MSAVLNSGKHITLISRIEIIQTEVELYAIPFLHRYVGYGSDSMYDNV